MLTSQELLQKLEHVKKSGAGWTARCPGHEDRENSLSLTEKEGKILLKCFAGCPVEQICQALAIEVKDLFAKPEGRRSKAESKKQKSEEPRTVVAEYVYADEHGHPVAKKIRYEPKTFSWERFESGEWKPGLGSVKTGLYRWAEIKESDWALITEGEKDADTAARLGLPGTTSGGVSTWTEAHSKALDGKRVVILADADAPGRAHARKVAQAIWESSGATTEGAERPGIKLLELPGAKDLTEAVEKGLPVEALLALIEQTPEWKPQPASDLLDEVNDFIRKYVSMGESASLAVTLWIAHTYAPDAAEYTPYIAILSPEKQSGKTRLLDVLNMLASRAEMMARTTAAALVRTIDSEKPTILLDEVDAIFDVRDDSEFAQALRGVLNSGYQINGFTRVCAGQGANLQVIKLSTYCPKALAGIGKLPDTVSSRALHIEMSRAKPRSVARMRISRVKPHADLLAAKLAAWVQSVKRKLREADPPMPDSLSDRQMDFCEPLLAIADRAGGGWPEKARAALVNLCINENKSDDSTGVELLRDIKNVFDPPPEGELGLQADKVDRIASKDLAHLLGEMEDRPWAAWSKGAPISPAQVARVLHRYRIGPKSLRMPGGQVVKGYQREQFTELWETYLPAIGNAEFAA